MALPNAGQEACKSRLSTALQDYLTIRRALGFHLKLVGWVLTRFVAYADEVGAETVTPISPWPGPPSRLMPAPSGGSSDSPRCGALPNTCKRSIHAPRYRQPTP